MMKTCLDEGTLQAYLDGELSLDASNDVAAHLSACASCTEAARAAEQELALFSTAYAPAFSSPVPTEKLRARLDEAIAGTRAPHHALAETTTPAASRLRSFFEALVASVTTFTPRQATAFASFLVAVALVLVFALMQRPDGPQATREVAGNGRMPAPPAATTVESTTREDAAAIQTPVEDAVAPVPASGVGPALARTVRYERTQVARTSAGQRGELRTADANAVNTNAANTTADANTTAATTAAATREPVLADEKTYLNSIASLTSAIEAEGAQGMTPTLRAEYERNLAVVNQAIVSSRVAARRNPQDADAKEFLRAAYQNKVELLSAVADQTQLASSRD
jgi:anti-sigma factor RsiW